MWPVYRSQNPCTRACTYQRLAARNQSRYNFIAERVLKLEKVGNNRRVPHQGPRC